MRLLATFPSYYNCFGVSEVIAAREACIHPVLCTVVMISNVLSHPLLRLCLYLQARRTQALGGDGV